MTAANNNQTAALAIAKSGDMNLQQKQRDLLEIGQPAQCGAGLHPAPGASLARADDHDPSPSHWHDDVYDDELRMKLSDGTWTRC